MTNIFDSCTYYPVRLDKLESEEEAKLRDYLGFDGEESIVYLSASDISLYEIDSNAIDYDAGYFEGSQLEDILQNYLDDYPYYLVFASNVRWNGHSGFMICENIIETVERKYEISLAIIKEFSQKAIACWESSHDNPTGSQTYIVGLTNAEYNQLENAEFTEIEKFIEKYKD